MWRYCAASLLDEERNIYIYIDVEEIKMARKENREIELEGGGGDGTRVHTGCRE